MKPRWGQLHSQAALRLWLFVVLAVAWAWPMMHGEHSGSIADTYIYVFAVWLGAVTINWALARLAVAHVEPEDPGA